MQRVKEFKSEISELKAELQPLQRTFKTLVEGEARRANVELVELRPSCCCECRCSSAARWPRLLRDAQNASECLAAARHIAPRRARPRHEQHERCCERSERERGQPHRDLTDHAPKFRRGVNSADLESYLPGMNKLVDQSPTVDERLLNASRPPA